MAIESVKQRIMALPPSRQREELHLLLASLVDGLQALCAKLDADGGVTDTNYAAIFATYIID